MIYISIPVHEKPEVIADQMYNFKKYFPQAKVILHLSKNAVFSIQELKEYLVLQQIDNVLINPMQFDTKWGSIIQAHLANIRYIIELGDAEKVIFHSSNDMLVRKGVFEFVKDKKYLFQKRKCANDSLWWVSRKAMEDRSVFEYFNGRIYASQIEGAMYCIEFLKLLIGEIDNQKLHYESDVFYPREEIIFSSFAYKYNIKSDALPYVYSEVHQFDKRFFSYMLKYRNIFNLNCVISKIFRKILERILSRYSDYKVNVNVIDDIINTNKNLDKNAVLNDNKTLSWNIYKTEWLFGVKRVERNVLDPIRIFIKRLI